MLLNNSYIEDRVEFVFSEQGFTITGHNVPVDSVMHGALTPAMLGALETMRDMVGMAAFKDEDGRYITRISITVLTTDIIPF